jgi:hypothetical protein
VLTKQEKNNEELARKMAALAIFSHDAFTPESRTTWALRSTCACGLRWALLQKWTPSAASPWLPTPRPAGGHRPVPVQTHHSSFRLMHCACLAARRRLCHAARNIEKSLAEPDLLAQARRSTPWRLRWLCLFRPTWSLPKHSLPQTPHQGFRYDVADDDRIGIERGRSTQGGRRPLSMVPWACLSLPHLRMAPRSLLRRLLIPCILHCCRGRDTLAATLLARHSRATLPPVAARFAQGKTCQRIQPIADRLPLYQWLVISVRTTRLSFALACAGGQRLQWRADRATHGPDRRSGSYCRHLNAHQRDPTLCENCATVICQWR